MRMTKAQFKKLVAQRNGDEVEEKTTSKPVTTWLPEEVIFASNYLEKSLECGVNALWMHRPLVHLKPFVCQPEFLAVPMTKGLHLVTIQNISRPRIQCHVEYVEIQYVTLEGKKFHFAPNWLDYVVSEAEAAEEVDSLTEGRFVQLLNHWLEEGEILAWVQQPSIRMSGQTYTPDFMTMTPAGEIEFHEIKGSYSLVSETRSSVKLRWAKSVLPKFRFYWHRYSNYQWKKREVKADLPRHSELAKARKVLKI